MNADIADKNTIDRNLLDVTQSHQVAEFKHEIALTTLRVDPTDRFVAAGAEDPDVQLWELASSERRTLKGHKSWVRSIDFSADGNRMFTACWGGIVNVWDTSQSEPKPLRTIHAHKGAARFVRVSPDGQQLATCGNDLRVKVWNIGDGKIVHEFSGHERHVYGVSFHPDGTHLVSQDLMGGINVWDLQSGKHKQSIDGSVMTGYDKKFAADMGGSRDLQFKADGSQWASAGITKVTNSFAGVQDPIVVLFDWTTGKEIKQIKSDDNNVKGIAWGVRFHPDNFVITAVADRSGKGELWFYRPEEEKAFHTMKLPSAARGLDLLSDNLRVAVAHADGHARIYRMTAKRPADTTTPAKAAPETAK
ncbi:MAG: WD40 repeat domain-containing protein [Fuerstiella sp.]|jgi:WD40 repeat protein|nr:WD40 repeat domain-containing protein [Fuerstiella sp.]MCP4505567.1 WD40 repeat domain-containing protein [Fuerstiella sp.]MDG2127360.1 WD40 repeat domain-containing protein [Fuerstiella sp.]